MITGTETYIKKTRMNRSGKRMTPFLRDIDSIDSHNHLPMLECPGEEGITLRQGVKKFKIDLRGEKSPRRLVATCNAQPEDVVEKNTLTTFNNHLNCQA